MPIIVVNDISPGAVLKNDYYHVLSGKLLLKKNEVFSSEKIRLLNELKIKNLFKGNSEDETSEFLQNVKYITFKVDESMKGKRFQTPLFDRKNRILIEADIPLTDSLIGSIIKNGGAVYQLKQENEINSQEADEFISRVSGLSVNPIMPQTETVKLLESPEIKNIKYDFDSSVEMVKEGVMINSDYVDNDLQKRKQPQKVEVSPNATSLEMGVKDPLVKRSENYKSVFNETYFSLIGEVSKLFKSILEKEKSKIDQQIKNICSRVVNTLIADKNFVINLTNLRNKNMDYLVQHSLNAAIFSINIAWAMGYSDKQIFELAFGALLCDLGMLKINKEILHKKETLSNEERRLIEKHPSFSLDYLNLIKGVPSSLPYIVYQSHERLDGSGYPKKRPSYLIHEYSKIIAIADTFDSLCTDHPWRKALIPYKAMEEIIKLASQKKLDGKIVRQWLFTISLFPVGSYVVLNDNSIAKVISSNKADFTRPTVRALSKNGLKLTESETIILNEAKTLKITQALSHTDVHFEVLDGF